jgi:uncharacterized membrane protein
VTATAPAWRRPTAGEHRWPAALATALAIGLQLLLPSEMTPQDRYVLPGIEFVLLLGLFASDPFRMNRETWWLRALGLSLSALVGLSNGVAVFLLVDALVHGRETDAALLLGAGGVVWLINVLAFALFYWELDRGGPAARAAARQDRPDFLFPQMQSPDMADPEWEPHFVDYLYLAFTNSTAFSPTDVLPLSRWVKVLMMVQAGIAVAVVVLVVARAVNVLG